ncbi:hypothetical protein M408DRAFT_30329 [Serendipita vermifera MAFF 305830]|uniref:Uncharacterized protein n=1 Tax=Serendipita vermifera MAFF 305830 TaxID=933852 RepID=A0A0C2WSF4_SERVB|nr:hypothetical protein M408DRAFT_30329 [Serendipita vermifera MAFF 305830]
MDLNSVSEWQPSLLETAFLFERLNDHHRPFLATRGELDICSDLNNTFKAKFKPPSTDVPPTKYLIKLVRTFKSQAKPNAAPAADFSSAFNPYTSGTFGNEDASEPEFLTLFNQVLGGSQSGHYNPTGQPHTNHTQLGQVDPNQAGANDFPAYINPKATLLSHNQASTSFNTNEFGASTLMEKFPTAPTANTTHPSLSSYSGAIARPLNTIGHLVGPQAPRNVDKITKTARLIEDKHGGADSNEGGHTSAHMSKGKGKESSNNTDDDTTKDSDSDIGEYNGSSAVLISSIPNIEQATHFKRKAGEKNMYWPNKKTGANLYGQSIEEFTRQADEKVKADPSLGKSRVSVVNKERLLGWSQLSNEEKKEWEAKAVEVSSRRPDFGPVSNRCKLLRSKLNKFYDHTSEALEFPLLTVAFLPEDRWDDARALAFDCEIPGVKHNAFTPWLAETYGKDALKTFMRQFHEYAISVSKAKKAKIAASKDGVSGKTDEEEVKKVIEPIWREGLRTITLPPGITVDALRVLYRKALTDRWIHREWHKKNVEWTRIAGITSNFVQQAVLDDNFQVVEPDKLDKYELYRHVDYFVRHQKGEIEWEKGLIFVECGEHNQLHHSTKRGQKVRRYPGVTPKTDELLGTPSGTGWPAGAAIDAPSVAINKPLVVLSTGVPNNLPSDPSSSLSINSPRNPPTDAISNPNIDGPGNPTIINSIPTNITAEMPANTPINATASAPINASDEPHFNEPANITRNVLNDVPSNDSVDVTITTPSNTVSNAKPSDTADAASNAPVTSSGAVYTNVVVTDSQSHTINPPQPFAPEPHQSTQDHTVAAELMTSVQTDGISVSPHTEVPDAAVDPKASNGPVRDKKKPGRKNLTAAPAGEGEAASSSRRGTGKRSAADAGLEVSGPPRRSPREPIKRK